MTKTAKKKLENFKSLDGFIKNYSNNQLGFKEYLNLVRKTTIAHSNSGKFKKAPEILKFLENENNTKKSEKYIHNDTLIHMFDCGIDWSLTEKPEWVEIHSAWSYLIYNIFKDFDNIILDFEVARKLNKKARIALGGFKKGKLDDI